ncbi:MAG: hypothetical protein C0415_01755 [Thermodesulfovibrio sp.]|nr:hypothetical protein [Thermodesulfovibrio sp.]
MKSQLYVPEMTRRYLKSEVQSFVEIYFQKLLPIFKDIESEADKLANDFYDNFMNQPAYDEYIDPSSIAEHALEMGIEHYSYLKLGKYNLTASWHATLYQLWEQQSRLFLFREMSHVYKIEFETFCTNLSEIKKFYKFHNVEIEQFSCWSKIKELCLLCNVIKHGDGDSAKRLRKIKPVLFKQEGEVDYMEAYKTTLLEETLNINEVTLNDYREALLSFWDEIPERNYSNEL